MHPAHSAAGEEGVALVTVALWLPLLVLFASFAIDVGNWFVHDRHLQLQADAGALAAAGDFRFPCDDAAIEARAREYSGSDGAAGYNHQVGGTPPDEVHFALNSVAYPEQPSKLDPTVVAAPPCEAGMIDVKLTETDLPLFLRVADLFASVPFINAHARVQIFKKRSNHGALPVAVPDTNPRKARVTFVDIDTGEILGERELTKSDTSEAGGLAYWDNASEPLPLNVRSPSEGAPGVERIGVYVALSGGGSTTCGDPLVACYDEEAQGDILFVRGYGTAGSGAQPGPPLARDAYLLGGDVCDRYFSSEEEGCFVDLHAEVDFGPCEEIDEVGPQLTAVAGGKDFPMNRLGCEGTTSFWETSGAPIPVPRDAGPVPIELEWAETKGEQDGNECTEGNNNKCEGSFGVVQRSFAGNGELSGPIRVAQILEGSFEGANSFEQCSIEAETCPAVVVRIGIDQTLREIAESGDEPPVALRYGDQPGSQNQTLDCDPDIPTLKGEIALGCAPEYVVNAGNPCPSSQAELWGSEPPWECVAIDTGQKVSQVFDGMNLRVHGNNEPTECLAPNNWPLFETTGLTVGDPRLLPLFLTPFGSFSGSGAAETVPVTNFAMFYVTGWAGEGGGNSQPKTSQEICPGDDLAGKGTIVGHFVKYVQALNDGSAGEETCDFDSLTPCVAVLTE